MQDKKEIKEILKEGFENLSHDNDRITSCLEEILVETQDIKEKLNTRYDCELSDIYESLQDVHKTLEEIQKKR